MTSNYQDIYSRFLRKITDYELAQLLEADANEKMYEWLRSSLSKTHIRRLFKTLSLDDEIAVMNYTMKSSVDDEEDKDFVEELISLQMTVEWVTPRVNNETVINQAIFNSKEAKLYSQANHGEMLMKLFANSKAEVSRMSTDRSFAYNGYLGNTND